MLNIEEYEEELSKLGVDFALIDDGQLTTCEGTNCEDCVFGKGDENCGIVKIKWLLEKNKEPILSGEARAYLKTIIEPIEGCYEIRKVLCFMLGTHELIFFNGDEYASLKYKTGTKLYKYFEGLDYGKNYSPKELGL